METYNKYKFRIWLGLIVLNCIPSWMGVSGWVLFLNGFGIGISVYGAVHAYMEKSILDKFTSVCRRAKDRTIAEIDEHWDKREAEFDKKHPEK